MTETGTHGHEQYGIIPNETRRCRKHARSYNRECCKLRDGSRGIRFDELNRKKGREKKRERAREKERETEIGKAASRCSHKSSTGMQRWLMLPTADCSGCRLTCALMIDGNNEYVSICQDLQLNSVRFTFLLLLASTFTLRCLCCCVFDNPTPHPCCLDMETILITGVTGFAESRRHWHHRHHRITG